MNQGFGNLKSALVVLATVGLVLPQPRIFAAEKTFLLDQPVKVLAENSIFDIRLGRDGTFTGRVLDHGGKPVESVNVVIKQGTVIVARAVSNPQGEFAVQNLKTGVYQVSAGTTEGVYRFWSEQSAPPSAKPIGLLVMGENGVRGQFGSMTRGGIILLAAGAAVGAAGAVAIVSSTKSHNSSPASP